MFYLKAAPGNARIVNYFNSDTLKLHHSVPVLRLSALTLDQMRIVPGGSIKIYPIPHISLQRPPLPPYAVSV